MTDPHAQLRDLMAEALEVSGPLVQALEDHEIDIQRAMPLTRARAYATVRREHYDTLYAAVVGYLDSSLPVTSYRNLAGRAVVEHYPEAFYDGYAEASGGDTVELEDDSWLTEQINQALGYVDQLFEALKALRRRGGYDSNEVAIGHAEAYAATLDAINGQGRLRGNLNIMLTFAGDDGKESCADCQRYVGQRHRARWWLKRDLVRRNGNENFACGRWDPCQHHLYRDSGELWAV